MMAGNNDWMKMTKGGSRSSAYSTPTGETEEERKARLKREKEARSDAGRMDRGDLSIRSKK